MNQLIKIVYIGEGTIS